jgi:hypothetical protein
LVKLSVLDSQNIPPVSAKDNIFDPSKASLDELLDNLEMHNNENAKSIGLLMKTQVDMGLQF